jgi:hypothetical protein
MIYHSQLSIMEKKIYSECCSQSLKDNQVISLLNRTFDENLLPDYQSLGISAADV